MDAEEPTAAVATLPKADIHAWLLFLRERGIDTGASTGCATDLRNIVRGSAQRCAKICTTCARICTTSERGSAQPGGVPPSRVTRAWDTVGTGARDQRAAGDGEEGCGAGSRTLPDHAWRISAATASGEITTDDRGTAPWPRRTSWLGHSVIPYARALL